MSSSIKDLWIRKYENTLKDIEECNSNLYSLSTLYLQLIKERDTYLKNQTNLLCQNMTIINPNEDKIINNLENIVKFLSLTEPSCDIGDTSVADKKYELREDNVTRNDMMENFNDIIQQYDEDQEALENMIDQRRKKMYAEQENNSQYPQSKTSEIQQQNLNETINETVNETIPAKQIKTAIPVNALTKLSYTNQQVLYTNIFIQAKKNVEVALGQKNIDKEQMDKLVSKEADRLLDLYVNKS